MGLVLCPSCGRHVKPHEACCPFCAAAIAPVCRGPGAIAFALALGVGALAGCAYGPPPAEDAGPDATAMVDAAYGPPPPDAQPTVDVLPAFDAAYGPPPPDAD
jgi:hypothetical protein